MTDHDLIVVLVLYCVFLTVVVIAIGWTLAPLAQQYRDGNTIRRAKAKAEREASAAALADEPYHAGEWE